MIDQTIYDTMGVDVVEDSLAKLHPSILKIMLQDKQQKNIVWATKDYESLGKGYETYSRRRSYHNNIKTNPYGRRSKCHE